MGSPANTALQTQPYSQVFDYDRDDSCDTIGHLDTSLNAMMQPNWTAALKDPKGKGKDVGSLVAGTVQVNQMPTLLNYLQGGLEIGLIAAIDFTASNGDPRNPRSLHYNSPDPNHQNPYEAAIRATGDVLIPYDRDGLVPAYGYGAELPPNGIVSHCFALNGQPHSPSVPGVEGILAVYNMALSTVRLSGPTCFAPVIGAVSQAGATAAVSQCCRMFSTPTGSQSRLPAHGLSVWFSSSAAAATARELRYTVLLIVTDGAIMVCPKGQRCFHFRRWPSRQTALLPQSPPQLSSLWRAGHGHNNQRNHPRLCVPRLNHHRWRWPRPVRRNGAARRRRDCAQGQERHGARS